MLVRIARAYEQALFDDIQDLEAIEQDKRSLSDSKSRLGGAWYIIEAVARLSLAHIILLLHRDTETNQNSSELQ